jgi:hypothetical protein
LSQRRKLAGIPSTETGIYCYRTKVTYFNGAEPYNYRINKEKGKITMPDIVKYVIGGVAGAVIGGAIGYFGKCSGST